MSLARSTVQLLFIRPCQFIPIFRRFQMGENHEERGVVYGTIKAKLEESFKPTHLEVINESFMHNVPKGSETHFKVVVVSNNFDGISLIKRHRLVNDVLKELLEAGLHALSIQAKTPEQWEKSSKVSESPPCLGGSRR